MLDDRIRSAVRSLQRFSPTPPPIESTRRRRLHRRAATAGAAVGVAGAAVAFAMVLNSGAQTRAIRVMTPTNSTLPARTVPTSPSGTTASTTPTAGSLSGATADLNAFVASRAAEEANAARAAGQTWYGYLHTPPVSDGGALVAVVAYSYDSDAKPLQVLTFTDGHWTQTAALPPAPGQGFVTPQGAVMNSSWLAYFPEAAISVADVTKDGRPDFLIPLNAADNVPGAVVSQDSADRATGWRYVPYTQGTSSTQQYIFARNARFQGNLLLTTTNDCNPNCAQGTTSTITWAYQDRVGLFSAPKSR